MIRITVFCICFLIVVFSFGSCLINNDRCESPDCEQSTNFRFNLIDSLGNDLVLGDSSIYELIDLEIRDSNQNIYFIRPARVSSDSILIVELDGQFDEYHLYLDNAKVDHFSVGFRETNEHCCGQTFWIDEIEFHQLDSWPPLPNIGSTRLVIDN